MKTVACVPIKLNNQRTPGKNIKKFDDGSSLITVFLSNLIKVKSFDDNLDKWIYFSQWSIWYPDLFYDLITPEKGGMRLDLDQRVFLRAMCRFLSTYGVMPRG